VSTQGKPLRVIAAFGYYNVGDIIYPTGVYRDQLKWQKLCVEVEREDVAVETATVAPAEVAAVRTAPRRRRKRRT